MSEYGKLYGEWQDLESRIALLETNLTYKRIINFYRRLMPAIFEYKGAFVGDWKDQVERASLSILLNVAEGIGKGGGFKKGYYYIARGSLFEVMAALCVGPLHMNFIDELNAVLEALDQELQKDLVSKMNKEREKEDKARAAFK